MTTMAQVKVDIVSYDARYAADFAELNFEWLRKYFYIEPYDEQVLLNPEEYIMNNGGEILFAIVDEKVVGTVALINRGDEGFELSKMAVTENYKGLRIGQKLMYACINHARKMGVGRLYLDSNRSLIPALRLYEKVGFREIPMPENGHYVRANIRMELFI